MQIDDRTPLLKNENKGGEEGMFTPVLLTPAELIPVILKPYRTNLVYHKVTPHPKISFTIFKNIFKNEAFL